MATPSVELRSRTAPASASSSASQTTSLPSPSDTLENLEKVIKSAIQNGGFQADDVEQVVHKALTVFRTVQSASYSPRSLRDTMRRINEASYEILRKKGRIGCCSWNRFFGPSYFEQLDAMLSFDMAQTNLEVLMRGAVHHRSFL